MDKENASCENRTRVSSLGSLHSATKLRMLILLNSTIINLNIAVVESLMKSKILYDCVFRTRQEFEKHMRKAGQSPLSLDYNQYFSALYSHYFAILHNNPAEIRARIKNQMMSKLCSSNQIAEESILGSGRNCEIYRISVPQQIVICRRDILDRPNAWETMKDLHTKGPRAIRNLIEKLEFGKFS
jgi:hypothetical protein